MVANQKRTAWSENEDLLLVATILEEVRAGNTMQAAQKIAAEKISKEYGTNRTKDAVGFRWDHNLKKSYETAYDLAKMAGKTHKTSTKRNTKRVAKTVVIAESNQEKNADEIETFISSTPTNDVEQLALENVQPEQQIEETPVIEMPVAELLPSSLNTSIEEAMRSLKTLSGFINNTQTDSLQIEALKDEIAMLKNDKYIMEQQFKEDKEKYEFKISKLEKRNEELEDDYNAVLRVIDKARKISVQMEEEQPREELKTQSNKFKMDRNGNLNRI